MACDYRSFLQSDIFMVTMKRTFLCLLPALLLASCGSSQPTTSETTPGTAITASGTTITASGSTKLPEFVNAQAKLRFSYPKDWKVIYASRDESRKKIMAWVYSPTAWYAIASCQKTVDRSEWQVACGSLYANAAIGIYDYGYIDYDGLGEFAKTNYPGYQPLNIKNLNAFQYDSTPESNAKNIHINNPNRIDGVTLITYTKDTETIAALGTILSTFAFTK